MSKTQVPTTTKIEQEQVFLKAELEALKKKLARIEQQTSVFEALLRSHISNEIIEEQELTILYKQQKKAKKDKRLVQKKRGKNYQEPTGLQHNITTNSPQKDKEDQKEKKRLYREAMLNVHPDKFSMQEDKQDLATEITSKLIDIYNAGTLEELTAYHTHILSGNAIKNIAAKPNKHLATKDTYLQQEIEMLKAQIELAKNRHTYIVLTTYKEPITFVQELKAYYSDRLSKLRRRTRSK